MNRKRTYELLSTVVYAFVLWSPSMVAQPDTLTLTLSSCIRMALEKGPAVEAARELYTSRTESYHSFRSLLYPQLRLRGEGPGYVRSISSIVQPDGTTLFTPQIQASSTLSLSLVQQIPWTGADLQISSGLNRIDLFEPYSVFYRSSPLSITFRQPLFQLNTYRWNSEDQELRKERADRQWAEAEEDISLDITNKFFEAYLAAMTLENARYNVLINDTLHQISTGRFNVGRIAENDLLQSELAFLNARIQFENATISFDRAQRALAYAIGIPKETPLHLAPPEDIPSLLLDPEKAVAEAVANRSDIVDMEIEKHTAERSLTQAQFATSFSATITANAGLNQRAGRIPDAYRHLLDQQQLSMSFEVPLVQWGAASAAVEAAMAEQRRIETTIDIRTNVLKDEVYFLVASLKLLQHQVGVSAKADTMAQRRFDVSKDRFLIGKIDVTNLFLAQNEKTVARRARIQTLWDFWAGYYRLRRLTLFDFEMMSRIFEVRTD